MSNNGSLIIGPYQVDTTGMISMVARDEGMYIQSAGLLQDLVLDSAGSLYCYASEMGMIQHALAPPDLGPRIQLEPGMITLAVGPPEGGTSITLTPESIVLQAGAVTLSLTPEGIAEAVAAVSREMTPEGCNITSAETELNVGVEGIMVNAPMKQENYDGAAMLEAALAQAVVDGMRTDQAGITTME